MEAQQYKFAFFANFKETADKLPDDLRLKFYDALTDYVFKGVEPEDAIISALITAVKPNLDTEDKRGGAREGAGAPKGNRNAIKNNQNYNFDNIKNNQINQNQSKSIKDNQIQSNEIKNNQVLPKEKEKNPPNNPQENKNKIYISPSSTTDVVVTPLIEADVKKPPKSKASIFQPPTLKDIESYIAERKCEAVVDAKKFFDYFEAGGWHDSEGKPVKNWKQKLITWEMEGRKKRTIRAARELLGVKSESYPEGTPL